MTTKSTAKAAAKKAPATKAAPKAAKVVEYAKEKARIKESFTSTTHVARTRRISKLEYGYVTKHHAAMLLFRRRGNALQFIGTSPYISKRQEFKG
jgi:hypothetical protein